MSSHGRASVHVCVLVPSSYRDTSPIGSGSTLKSHRPTAHDRITIISQPHSMVRCVVASNDNSFNILSSTISNSLFAVQMPGPHRKGSVWSELSSLDLISVWVISDDYDATLQATTNPTVDSNKHSRFPKNPGVGCVTLLFWAGPG